MPQRNLGNFLFLLQKENEANVTEQNGGSVKMNLASNQSLDDKPFTSDLPLPLPPAQTSDQNNTINPNFPSNKVTWRKC